MGESTTASKVTTARSRATTSDVGRCRKAMAAAVRQASPTAQPTAGDIPRRLTNAASDWLLGDTKSLLLLTKASHSRIAVRAPPGPYGIRVRAVRPPAAATPTPSAL